MFTLINYARSGKEIFEFDTKEKIEAKLEELRNLYPGCHFVRYYTKDGMLESISITTDPTQMTFYFDS